MSEDEGTQVGTIIDGRYEIDKLIARGGFTEIYRAVDLETDETVAFKILELSRSVRANTIERFTREAEIVGDLESPHTVRVYEWGQTDAFLWMRMEYIRGRSLWWQVDHRGPLHPRQAAELGVQICDSLIEVHAEGYLHRDLKPSNIMLSRNDEGDIVAKVLDFGVVKILQPEADELKLTRSGSFIGTPRYASPEQMRKQPLEPASDVYGVGMVLWEAVVGTPAVPDTDYSTAVEHHLSDDPWVLPEKLDCPPEFGAIVQKSLAKWVDQRYLSCVDLKDALVHFLEGHSSTRPPNEDRREVSGSAREAVAEQQRKTMSDKYKPDSLEDVEAEDELFGEVVEGSDSHIEDVNVMARSDLSESSSSKSHIPLADRRHSDHAGVDPAELRRGSGATAPSGGNNMLITGVLLAVLVVGGLYLFTAGGDDAQPSGDADVTKTDESGAVAATDDNEAEEPPPESDEGKGDGTPTLDAETISKGIVASGWRIKNQETDKMDEVRQTTMLATKEKSGATVTVYESRTWEWAEKLLGQTEPPTQAITFGRTVVRVSDGPQDKSNGAIELGNALRKFKDQAREKLGEGTDAPAEGQAPPTKEGDEGATEDKPAE